MASAEKNIKILN